MSEEPEDLDEAMVQAVGENIWQRLGQPGAVAWLHVEGYPPMPGYEPAEGIPDMALVRADTVCYRLDHSVTVDEFIGGVYDICLTCSAVGTRAVNDGSDVEDTVLAFRGGGSRS